MKPVWWSLDRIAGRTLATTLALIALSQLIFALVLGGFVLRPQAQRVGSIVAHSIIAVSHAAAAATPDVRARMIQTLGQSDFLDVWPGTDAPPTGGPPPRWLELIFMRALVDGFGPDAEIVWRTDPQRRLWVQVQIGPDRYWFSSRVPPSMQPVSVLMWTGAATLLLSLVAAIALQRRIAEPLEALSTAVETSAPTAPIRVADRGAREIGALVEAFNMQRARLAAVETERAIMLAGVSHDIRTPLAKLRLAIEMIAPNDEALIASVHRQVREIDRLLDQFLVFAKTSEAEAPQTFELDALVSEVIAAQTADGVALQHDGDQLGSFHGRPESLRRALLNLVENAVRHGAPPIIIRTRLDDDAIVVAVRDFGKGVAPDAIGRLALPFHRGDAPRGPGAGLGLAIVEQAAIAHGGRLEFENVAGGGFEARIRLPRR